MHKLKITKITSVNPWRRWINNDSWQDMYNLTVTLAGTVEPVEGSLTITITESKYIQWLADAVTHNDKNLNRYVAELLGIES